MLELIAQNNNQITMIVAIVAGLCAFLKWLDTRNQNVKNERYNKYIQLIKVLSGSKENDSASICMTEQIASAWFLLEYKEYYKITLKILDNDDLQNMSNKPWQNFVLPQIKLVVQEITNQMLTNQNRFRWKRI